MQILCKLLGCVCLVLTGAGLGAYRAGRSLRRARLLAAMAAYVEEVAAAMQCAPCPTARLLQGALAGAGGLPLNLASLRDGPGLPGQVHRALIQARRLCPEVPQHLWIQFTNAVERVGQADTPQVVPTLTMTGRQLTAQAQQAAEQAQQDRKLYHTLGLCAGAAAALLLV